MRVHLLSLLLVVPFQVTWAVEGRSEDGLVKNSHLSCKLARDIRRRDVEQSKSAFQFYLDNKAALLAVDDTHLVEGLTAAKVKSFCSRIEGDFQRQDALLIYDKAIAACQASHAFLEKGSIKQAKQQFGEFKTFLDEATNTSREAVELGHGSLQWRKCEGLEQDLNEFTSGKVKKMRDRLSKAYARCLPIWSEMSTQRQSSLSYEQISARLDKMKAELSSLRLGVKKLKTPSLNPAVQELQTCISQVKAGLPAQFARQRLSALEGQLQYCRSNQRAESFQSTVAELLEDKQQSVVQLTPEQKQEIAQAESELRNCASREQEPPVDPLQLDIEIEQESPSGDVVQEMLQEEVSVSPVGDDAVKPVIDKESADDAHWKALREEPIQLGR